MRIVIVGTSGAGKTTLARRLAAELSLALIELDRINWQPGWHSLEAEEPYEFIRRVAGASAGEDWVSDGNYALPRPLLWARATHLVWLDYGRRVVMSRVVRRSLLRAIDRRELWPGTGNRERWSDWLRPTHPIRWAWSTWRQRRIDTAARLSQPQYAHLVVLHLHHPREARSVGERLRPPA
jgi:adenylate kinase family enzyme